MGGRLSQPKIGVQRSRLMVVSNPPLPLYASSSSGQSIQPNELKAGGSSPSSRTMATTTQYRQCFMRRQLPDGSAEVHVAFLPTEFAKVGKVVDLTIGEEDKKGFKVEFAGDVRTIEDVDRWRDAHKRFDWVLGN
jgi:hypothetical protein